LLSNRKLTGRKRIAFDNNVHKTAIFSDELENVKQLNFSLQKFESENIEFHLLDCAQKISTPFGSNYFTSF
jgi:hypothetical protein